MDHSVHATIRSDKLIVFCDCGAKEEASIPASGSMLHHSTLVSEMVCRVQAKCDQEGGEG